MKKVFYTYIVTNSYTTTFYIGVTNDLQRRIFEHMSDLIEGFTKRYKLHKLIYFEEYATAIEAIEREKQIKNWHRNWKVNLIKAKNPRFEDLSKRWRS